VRLPAVAVCRLRSAKRMRFAATGLAGGRNARLIPWAEVLAECSAERGGRVDEFEGVAAGDGAKLSIEDVSGTVAVGCAEVVSVEKIKWMAERVSEALKRALPADEQLWDELRQVVTGLTALQSEIAEWVELHHLLHEVLTAFFLFRACLVGLRGSNLGAVELQTLLQNWRPCQDRIDALVDFAEGVECIGSPFRREAGELRGEHWVVDIVALQLLVEGILKEGDIDLDGMLELAEEFTGRCLHHLALADRELRVTMDRLQQVSTCLLGGML